MSTWHHVDPSLEPHPIRASSGEFQSAADHFYRMSDTTDDVVRAFCQLRSGDRTRFSGKAAEAFVSTLDQVADDLSDLPRVARDIGTIFHDHAVALANLRTEVDRALANALVTRSERDRNESDYNRANQLLGDIRRQLASLRSAGTDESDPQVTRLVTREGRTRNERTAADGRLRQSRDALRAATNSFHAFRSSEDQLNGRTAGHLHEVDVRNLGDPSNLEKALGSAGDFLAGVGAFLVEFQLDQWRLIAAVFRGDWDEALWRLNDVLRSAAVIAGVVLLFVPGVGPVAAALVVAALAGLTLATSLLLRARGTINTETGEAMSWQQIGRDARDFALAGVTAAGTVAAARRITVVGQARTAIATGSSSNLVAHLTRTSTEVRRLDRLIAGRRASEAISGALMPEQIIESSREGNRRLEEWRHIPPPSSILGPTRGVVIGVN